MDQLDSNPAKGRGKLNIRTTIIIASLIVLITLPAWGSQYIVMIFFLVMLYMALGQMWNLLGGYAGLVSLGQQIFIGIGAYSVSKITVELKLHFIIGIILGGIISALFALLISRAIFKMSGVYFTIGTWIVSQALALTISNIAFFKYAQGYSMTVSYSMSNAQLYYMALICGVGSVVVVYVVLRSKLGLALMAIRDNQSAAEAMGINIYRTKLSCFLISAGVTGMLGAVFYIYLCYVQPWAVFSIDWTVAMVFLVIIGGLGTIEGPIIGAIIYTFLRQYLYNFPGYSMVLLGAIAIAIILLAPKGIMGFIQDRTGFELLTPRRTVESLKKSMLKRY